MNTKTRYTKELLAPIVASNCQWVHVLKALGLVPAGGNYKLIQHWVKYWGLDTSHFKGTSWNKGIRDPYKGKNRIADADLFKRGVKYRSSALLSRLLKIGYKHECACCGIGPEWNGKPLRLQVDHINGDSTDNRIENLRILCPNCHSQTKTYAKAKKT